MTRARTPWRASRRHSAGFTLIELLVACTISLIVTLAAFALLIVSRQGFTSTDSASQLRENARFAADIVQRLILQSGFKDIPYAATPRPRSVAGVGAAPPGGLFGFDSGVPDADAPFTEFFSRGQSDALVVRFQIPETFPGSGRNDGSMIDCSGAAPPRNQVPSDRDSGMQSVFFVSPDASGEPTLYCTTTDAAGVPQTFPLLRGVESFQVLYGVDGLVSGGPPADPDSVPDSHWRADQLTVSGDPAATSVNWRRVRSVRIGMLLRGPLGSALETEDRTHFPLGNLMDAGTAVDPPPDTRLRQVVTFTVHLRNSQGQ